MKNYCWRRAIPSILKRHQHQLWQHNILCSISLIFLSKSDNEVISFFKILTFQPPYNKTLITTLMCIMFFKYSGYFSGYVWFSLKRTKFNEIISHAITLSMTQKLSLISSCSHFIGTHLHHECHHNTLCSRYIILSFVKYLK